jgi:hypothetical protein
MEIMSWNDLSAIGLLAAGVALIYAAGEAQERALAVVLAGSAVFPVSMATVLWGRGDKG